MNLSALFIIGKSLSHTALFLKEDRKWVDAWLEFISMEICGAVQFHSHNGVWHIGIPVGSVTIQ